MNREALRNRISSRIQTVRLSDGTELPIRRLSAFDRAKVIDDYSKNKNTDGNQEYAEFVAETQCFICSRAILDDDKKLMFQTPEEVNEELEWPDIQMLYFKILEISAMTAGTDPEKNSQPIPKDASASDLQQPSGDGMSMTS